MDRTKILELMTGAKLLLGARYGVTHLSLFGSMARGSENPRSEIDILVGFDGEADADRYFGVLFYLEDLLGRPVDLVTEKALRPEFRPFMEIDAIHA